MTSLNKEENIKEHIEEEILEITEADLDESDDEEISEDTGHELDEPGDEEISEIDEAGLDESDDEEISEITGHELDEPGDEEISEIDEAGLDEAHDEEISEITGHELDEPGDEEILEISSNEINKARLQEGKAFSGNELKAFKDKKNKSYTEKKDKSKGPKKRFRGKKSISLAFVIGMCLFAMGSYYLFQDENGKKIISRVNIFPVPSDPSYIFESFIIPFQNKQGYTYIYLNLSFELSNVELKDEIIEKKDQLRGVIYELLIRGIQTVDDARSLEELKALILEKANNILTSGKVREAVITDFLLV